MLSRILIFFTFLSVICASSAFGQARFEIQPFVGAKFGGSVPVQVNVFQIGKIDFDSSIDYGLTAGFNATPNIGLEFMWERQPTHAVAVTNSGFDFGNKIPVNLDQYHGNVVFTFRAEKEKLRPFILFGMGATRAAGNRSSETKFSFGIGGGAKYNFTDHMGVRLQARYTPTFVYSSASGVWCDWYGFCFVIPNNHYLQQFDLTAGWVFRF